MNDHKTARHIIKSQMKDTAYADGTIYVADMVDMLKWKGFGKAETQVIIAALTLAGAKWKPRNEETEV